MFLQIAGFEFRYQVRSPVFWVAVLLFGLLAFAAIAVDQIHVGGDNSNIHRNAPFTVAMLHLVLSVFYMFASTAIVANVVVRDDETGFGPILRSSRIVKFDYLYGRFTGAFAAVALGYLAVSLGALLGGLAPWLDRETVGPVKVADFLHAYAFLALPSIFLTSAVFFAVATATRSMMATYVTMVGLLMIWMFSITVTDKPEFERVMAFAEPFGLGAYSFATKYWTVVERNTTNLPMDGIFLWSRLIWLGVALLALASAFPVFRFAEPAVRMKAGSLSGAVLLPQPSLVGVVPAAPRADASWLQFTTRTPPSLCCWPLASSILWVACGRRQVSTVAMSIRSPGSWSQPCKDPSASSP